MEKDKGVSIRTGVKFVLPDCIRICVSYRLSGSGTEKRAYPQVIGIDWKKEEQRYTVWMHMAFLAEDTGQRKQSAETQPGNELYFTGSMGRRSILLTKRPGKQYLDIGHVKAIIFGTSLRENRERLREVLTGMESESSPGNSLCIFNRQSFGTVAGCRRAGDLTGRFSYRARRKSYRFIGTDTGETCGSFYRSCHTDTALPQIPGITVKDRVLMVEKIAPGDINVCRKQLSCI